MEQKAINTRAELDQAFFDELSSIGKELFSEYISELSRTRQIYLFLSAFVSVLITFAFVSLAGGEISGIEFSVEQSEMFPLLAAVVCFYFLVTYLISVINDYQQVNYKTLPAINRLETLKEKLNKIQAEREAKIDATEKVLGELSENKDSLNKRLADINNWIDQEIQDLQKIVSGLGEVKDRVQRKTGRIWRGFLNRDRESEDAINLVLLETQTLQNKAVSFNEIKGALAQVLDAIEQRSEEAKNQAVAKAQNDFVKLVEAFPYDYFKEKIDLLDVTYSRYKRLNRVNTIFEVIFPAILAVFAIVSAGWSVYINLID